MRWLHKVLTVNFIQCPCRALIDNSRKGWSLSSHTLYRLLGNLIEAVCCYASRSAIKGNRLFHFTLTVHTCSEGEQPARGALRWCENVWQ
eukprot:3884913-Pyramimonas_sp.AAC.2